jgi:hypothetical protein
MAATCQFERGARSRIAGSQDGNPHRVLEGEFSAADSEADTRAKLLIAPIPGTTKLHRLEENLGAVNVELTADDLLEIDDSSGSKVTTSVVGISSRVPIHGRVETSMSFGDSWVLKRVPNPTRANRRSSDCSCVTPSGVICAEPVFSSLVAPGHRWRGNLTQLVPQEHTRPAHDSQLLRGARCAAVPDLPSTRPDQRWEI